MTVMYAKGFEQTLEKTDGTCASGDDNLFTISGGPILVSHFYGLVTTVIGNTSATCTIQHACTDPAADIALSTAVRIDTDAVGTTYYIDNTALGVFTPVTAGSVIIPALMLPWLLTPGNLQATFSATNTGAIRWFIVYKMLSQYSKVIAAA
uniref:Uncharacterized protein n=1 Tax=viral metagenome TaxID=1070528 RepID=A0A6M3LD32_9ZZZZ